mmetsp:Transcript_32792/g.57081  ORF Transcript_32792/g.57081 Transcript_32792/m.57081 type:complete len:370 (+) Transcript_32792:101-1210(+)
MDGKPLKPTFRAAENARTSTGLQPRRRPGKKGSLGQRESVGLDRERVTVGPTLSSIKSPLSIDEVMNRNRALLDEIIHVHAVSPPSGVQSIPEVIKPAKVEDPEPEEQVDVLCLNCYSCVAIDEVDFHSQSCFEQKTTNQDEFVCRAQKLYQSLWNSKQKTDATRQELFQDLLNIAKALLTNSEDFKKLQADLNTFITKSALRDLSLCIFARRLLYLTDEYPQKSDPVDPSNLTSEQLLSHYERELNQQRTELEKWKRKSELLMKAVQNKDIYEVTSDVGSEVERTSMFSGYSEMSSPGYFDDIEEPEHSSEEMQKIFYSSCLKIKMGLPKNHPCQSVLISALYEKCLRDQIPISSWDTYIKANMGVLS